MSELEQPAAKRIKLEPNEPAQTDSASQNNETPSSESITDAQNDATKFDGASTSKYGNYVTPEELDKLREFKVLDEVKSNDEDSHDEDSDSSDGKSEGLPEEEIEKMLEEDLPEGFKGAPKTKERPYVIRQKILLEEKGVNQFEVLPLDWLMVRHTSGIPVYMHRGTRVCTLAKPYFLGKGNTRRHEIPISAIPCLAYRRALEEEEKQKEIDKNIAEQIKNGTWVGNDNKNGSQKDTQNIDFSKDVDSHHSQVNTKYPETLEIIGDSTLSQENNQAQKVTESSQISPAQSLGKCPFAHRKSEKIQNTDSKASENVENENGIHKSVDAIESNELNKSTDQRASIDQLINEDQQKSNDSNKSDYQNESGDLHTINDINMSDQSTTIDQNIITNQQEIEATNVGTDKSDQPNESTDQHENGDNNKSNDENAEKIPLNRRPVVLPGGIVMPPPRVETVQTSWKSQHLTAEQINNYCKDLFKFKTVNIMHFKRWADRRKYTKARKTLQYPTLPEGTKLITIPAQSQNSNENGGKAKRDWVMNMNGSSYLSVFHEYVWRALHQQPVYEFKQLENASCPYQATVYIGGMRYGVGHGSSKRQAKSAAARSSIHILIPEMQEHLDPHHDPNNEPDFSFFDYVGIEDPRIQEFCAATAEPSPHAILRTCLLRNFGAQDRHIHTEMKKLEYQKIELTMKVGKHSATVVCKNKKQAKQRASQSILQQLHPHIRSWGSLLRLYGSRSVKSCKEKKIEEQQITLLQDKARHNEPNYAVLEKLRNEMRKLRARDDAVVPIGTLLLAGDHLPRHSASNLNNVQL